MDRTVISLAWSPEVSDKLRDNRRAHSVTATDVHGRVRRVNCGNALMGRTLALLHTEEVTGSIPVSPTSQNGPSRDREGPFDYTV
ncbi:hypothetical protein GCM10010464_32330 [Pseudonocardia yunnanensis]